MRFQGGIGPAGLASEDLHVLDFTDMDRPRWHRSASLAHTQPAGQLRSCSTVAIHELLAAAASCRYEWL